MEDMIVGKDTLIRSGPYLHLQVPGKTQQYSSINMENLATAWECTDFRYSLKNGVATMISEGQYKNLKASFYIRIDENGTMEISYEARVGKTKKTIQEAGINMFSFSSVSLFLNISAL